MKHDGPPARRLHEELERLRAEIRRHDHLYYVLDRPEISDADYDRLFARLSSIERTHPEWVSPDSPTQRVAGTPAAAFPSVSHLGRMLSLESTTRAEDVRRFLERIGGRPLVIEPKLDGVSIEVVYEHGVLTRASTRGDGLHGEGVTDNVRTIRAVPLRLEQRRRPAPALLAVRGEVLMPTAAFATLNAQLGRSGEPPFANPRNAAAGSLRQLDARISAGRRLEVRFYDVLAQRGGRMPTSQWALLAALADWGLPTSAENRRATTADEVLAYHAELLARRTRLPFEIDGIVVKLDDLAARQAMGATARHPRWALAFKFAARSAVTRLEDIAVQVGRSGVLTPVAVVAPVAIGGVTVTRATLHNREELARKDLRIGDRVEVARAGDVIPEVLARVPQPGRRRRPFVMPARCPACGARVVQDGPFDRCSNGLACPAQLKRTIEHFASRDALDIRGLGARTIDALVDGGWVRDVAGVLALDERQLSSLERFGAQSARNLARAIAGARRTELGRFLYALGIPGVGVGAARALEAAFGALPAIVGAGVDELARAVGPATAAQVKRFFAQPDNRRVVGACLRAGLVLERRAGDGGPLAGQTFVFTGTLAAMPRHDAEARVRELGARTATTVSRATTAVVAGSDPGSKLERARALGVRVLHERDFQELVGADRAGERAARADT